MVLLWIGLGTFLFVVLAALALAKGPASQTFWTAVGALGTTAALIFAGVTLGNELRITREQSQPPVVTYEWFARISVDEGPSSYVPPQSFSEPSTFVVFLRDLPVILPPDFRRLESEASHLLQQSLSERGRVNLVLSVRNNSRKIARDIAINLDLPKQAEIFSVQPPTRCDETRSANKVVKIRCSQLRFGDTIEVAIEVPISNTVIPVIVNEIVDESQVLDGFYLNSILETNREYERRGKKPGVVDVSLCTHPPWLVFTIGISSDRIRKMVMPEENLLISFVWGIDQIGLADQFPSQPKPSNSLGETRAKLFGPPCF